MRREKRRQELIAQSLSIVSGVAIAFGGGDMEGMLRPFYTAPEWARYKRDLEEARQIEAERQQIAMLEALSRRS